MEAFDQPWKERSEGKVGAYWGVYDADRQQKFAFNKPIVRIPHWHVLAAASVITAAVLLWLFYFHSRTLRKRGRSFLAIVVYATATLVVWILYDFSQQYMTVTSVRSERCCWSAWRGVIAVLLAEAHEWAEAHWVTMHRAHPAAAACRDAELPPVSIHVPACNEPPEMLIETLDALAAARLSRLRSARHRQQHRRPAGLAPRRGALPAARRPLPFLPRRAPGGIQGGCAQLRASSDGSATRRSSR